MRRWVKEKHSIFKDASWDYPCLTNNPVESNPSLKILSIVLLAAGLNLGGSAFVPPAVAMQTPRGYTHILQGQD